MQTTAEPVAKQQDDMELVKQAREGSEAAFDGLFQRHKTFIYNVCCRMLGSREDAVDATQNAFISAYQSIGGFKGRSSFRSWVCRIAINECTAQIRREQRRRALSEKAPLAAGNSESRDRVWEAVLALPAGLRSVLVLFYFQGLSCQEAAQALGCLEGTIKTRLHRARAAFKKQYEELEQ